MDKAYSINGNIMDIMRPGWSKMGFTTIREDYFEEITSAKWWKSGEYLHDSQKGYLHCYIMKKWYGIDKYEIMSNNGFVVDHMNGNGFDCTIENLSFLAHSENIAKGHTLDKYARDKRYIALNMFKDFSTDLFQISVVFNYPARLIWDNPNEVKIYLVHLLYDKNTSYEMVINDARHIFIEYNDYKTFNPNRLNFVDFIIEGEYGNQPSIDYYTEYINGNHNHTVAYVERKAMIDGWKSTDNRHCLHILKD